MTQLKLKDFLKLYLTLLTIFSFLFSLTPKSYASEIKKSINTDGFYWIVYDNVCPYCRSSKKHIKSLDWENKFKFLSYRDSSTYKKFPFLNKEECKKDVHMVTPKGEVLAGYEVFRTIIDNLTATKLINPLLKNDFAEKKLNEIYERMVKERSCYYKGSETCPINKKKAK